MRILILKKIENLIWKIAHNIWSTRAKKYIKEKKNISYDETFDIGYEENMLDKIVYKEIVNNLGNIGLTKNESTSFKLYYMDGLSINEISKKIGTTESNIKYYLYSSRKKVKERYNYE